MNKFHSTIWVCVCCMLSHANGECCEPYDDWHDESNAPWCSVDQSKFHVTMGMLSGFHSCCECTHEADCPEHGDDAEAHHEQDDHEHEECDCETSTYSTSQCDGCGSYLHGERHAFTLWEI